MKKLIFLFSILLIHFKNQAQSGCTDPQATNYSATAVINDGSCLYPSTNLNLQLKANLATSVLDESSGIEFLSNGLWTHNDSGNPNSIYRVDSTNGNVLQTVTISNATNVDWEDITSGPDYLYIGDFGNNNGNRTDLKIYRIAKSALTPGVTTVTAGIINFSYSDQTSFVSAPNNNNFDCESVIFYHDSLHLFSKNWVDKQCRHYVLPATPGTHVAQVKESFNAGNLITGAAIQEGGVIALIGYDKTGIIPISMWMLYDYHGGVFFNGNKRKFNLSSAIVNGQTEAVDFKNGAYGYISNERFQQSPINIAPTIKSFDLSPYLPASFVYPAFFADFTVDTDTICKGSSVAFTDYSALNPVSWLWSFPGGIPASSMLQNPTVTYNNSGKYSVTLFVNNAGGGVDTLVKNNLITVLSPPASPISASGSTIFCAGGSVLLNGSIAAGLSYTWKKNGNVINGATSPSYLATGTGSYKIIVTNAYGCSKASSTVPVMGSPAATVTASGPLSFCAGDSVVFTASSGNGYTYAWKKNGNIINGAVFSSYTAKAKGTYKTIVTNSFGCSKTSNSKTATVNCRTDETFPEGVSNISLKNDVIYPNPAEDQLTLTVNADVDHFQLYDMLGNEIQFQSQIVLKQHERTFEIDIHSLAPGIYMIKLFSANQPVILKFVKS